MQVDLNDLDNNMEYELDFNGSDSNDYNGDDLFNDYNEMINFTNIFESFGFDINENEPIFSIHNNLNTENESLYNGSQLNLKEFCIIFLRFCNKMKLNKINRDLLLNFIKNILPINNNIPNSYYKLLSLLKIKIPKSKRICTLCHADLININETQIFCRACNKNDPGIEISNFNLNDQLICLVKNQYHTIQNYKSNN